MPLTDPDVETTLRPPVLFLHGQAFTSAIWESTGSLQMLGAAGHRAVAIDLPGYGKSVWGSEQIDGYLFIANLIQQLHLGRPILVVPSLGGKYAMPYLMGDPATASQRVRGLVAIAPAFAERYTPSEYRQLNLPVLYLYGERDEHLGKQGLRLFGEISAVETRMMPAAGHACYVEQPDLWRTILMQFVQRVQASVDKSPY